MFIAHREQTSKPVENGKTSRQLSPLFSTINVFKELMDYLNHAPETQRTEILLADFSAKVGAFGGRVCLGIFKNHYKLIDATLLLNHYGIGFHYRRRFDNELIVYAEA